MSVSIIGQGKENVGETEFSLGRTGQLVESVTNLQQSQALVVDNGENWNFGAMYQASPVLEPATIAASVPVLEAIPDDEVCTDDQNMEPARPECGRIMDGPHPGPENVAIIGFGNYCVTPGIDSPGMYGQVDSATPVSDGVVGDDLFNVSPLDTDILSIPLEMPDFLTCIQICLIDFVSSH